MSGRDPYAPLDSEASTSSAEQLGPNPMNIRLVTHSRGDAGLFAAPQVLSDRLPRRTRQAFAAILLAAGLIAAVVSAGRASTGLRRPAPARSQVARAVVLSSKKADSDDDEDAECHTAKEGERCYDEVRYQQKNIKKHPEWFHELDAKSTFEDFQRSLYKQDRCPKPCKGGKGSVEAVGGDAVEVEEDEDEDEDTDEDEDEKESETTPKPKAAAKPEAQCHTTVEGEKCHSAVKWVLKEGIFAKPEWYKGLTRASHIEEVQAKLHKNDPSAKCPMPCKCHTAENGDKCHKSVLWVMTEGTKQHPDWYPGLSITSRFEAVQARLHKDRNSTCDQPCTPLPYGSPSVFCFSVVRSSGYEPHVARESNRRSFGIFACDEYAVYSDKRIPLGAGFFTITFVPATVGKSKDGTAGNALLFMNVWTSVKNDFRSKNLDWTVKVDPDAVLLPDRLRQHLSKHTGESAYVKNCGAYDAPGWPKLFGAIEIFSRKAMEAYFGGEAKCKSELDWYSWGEDLYMEKCMDHLGVGNFVDLKIASDGACIHEPNCKDGWAAAFHPFKSWDSWHACLKTTIR